MVEQINTVFDSLIDKVQSKKQEYSHIRLSDFFFNHYLNTIVSCKEETIKAYKNAESEMNNTRKSYSDIPELIEANERSIKNQFNVTLDIRETLINGWMTSKGKPSEIKIEKVSLKELIYEIPVNH